MDVTRGVAVLGMMAVHVFGTLNREGGPTVATLVAGGRSAATFAVVAGLSLAFLSGGRAGPRPGRGRITAAGIAARGVAIGFIGLVLAYLGSADVILSSYGLLFLLAIPLLWAGPRLLAAVAVAAGLIGPVLVYLAADGPFAYHGETEDPTLTSLVTEPLGVLSLLMLSGAYPVVVYLAYVSTGLAVGRLDLRSRRVAWRLLGGGLVLAALAQGLAAHLLFSLGGMSRLLAAVQAEQADDADDDDDGDGEAGSDASDGMGFDVGRATDELRWEDPPLAVDSWWYLALPSPHAHTPLDVAHTIGSALALLGLALLVCRIRAFRRALRPLADIGSMPLTIYSAHLVVLATPLLERRPRALFLAMTVAAMVFAVAWRRMRGQGPMERLLASLAGRARDAAARRSGGGSPSVTGGPPDGSGSPATEPSKPPPPRNPASTSGPSDGAAPPLEDSPDVPAPRR